ncbi:MarR family transcriptional regulator [Clavibacter cf. michiganensis LMG 26808]|nr:MarR family transcriptional regulator [Clavibacter cf. michiganensis LMG 26808]
MPRRPRRRRSGRSPDATGRRPASASGSAPAVLREQRQRPGEILDRPLGSPIGPVVPAREPGADDPPHARDRERRAPVGARAVEAGTDPLALESQVCFAAVLAARSVVALYRPILEPLGLTHPQYLVMLALWERDGRSISDLGGALALEPATITPLLKRLQSAGLLERARSAEDERVVRVTLTDAGRALRREAEQVPARVAERTGMTPSELGRIRDDLHEFLARIDAAPDPAGA